MSSGGDRIGVVSSNGSMSTRVVVGISVATCLALNIVGLARNGSNGDTVSLLAALSEVIVALMAAYLLAKRGLTPINVETGDAPGLDSAVRFDTGVALLPAGRVQDDERDDALMPVEPAGTRAGWRWLAAGAVAWAAGQTAWVVVLFGMGDENPTMSVSSIGFVGWSLFTAIGLVKLGDTSKTAVRTLVGEAVVLSLAIGFLVWELALASDITDESNLTIVLLALGPISSSIVVAIALLLWVQARSPVIGIFVVASSALVIADSVLPVRFADRVAFDSSAHVLYLMTFTLIALAPTLPHHKQPRVRRSSLVRLCLVHASLFASFLVGAWHLLIEGRKPTIVSIGIAAVIGVVLLLAQVAHGLETEELAGRLDSNIDRLLTTESELYDLLDDLPEAVVVISANGSIRDLNARTLDLTGRAHSELIGQPLLMLVGEEHRRELYGSWQQLLSDEQLVSPVFPLRHVDGTEVMVEADICRPITNPGRLVVTLRDITKRLDEANALEQAQTRFGLAFRSAPTGMAMAWAADLTLIEVNDALAQMLGYTPDQLIGLPISDLTHPDDRADPTEHAGHELTNSITNTGDNSGDRRYVRQDRQVVWAHSSVGMMTDRLGREIAIVHIQDVTDQRKAGAQLQWAASHDELTGVANRSHFLERLRLRLAGTELGSIAVLFIDLDNFKVINDSLGHAIGDELLRKMSERLRLVVRPRDLLGRFGGDEFIVMLDGLHATITAPEIAERIRREMSQPVVIDGSELFVTGSIGIAYADRAGVTADELLRDADAAMYRAKTRGRDCVEAAFSPGARETSTLALRTASELRRGLERGEIVPYYQPIVDLATGQLTGFEALARWLHPDRGVLSPDQFLPMAEETGLIGELGASILKASLAQLGRWQATVESLAHVSMAVNVSVRQLVDSRFHTVVAEALAETGVRADSVWLEITESALMSDVRAATTELRDLRSLGVHLSVDDFGTGYSSLTYLKRFPVEAIKVDRSFVNGLGIDPEDTTIVEAVVNLGRSLGLMVIAEGVETPLQLSLLREAGCDRAQGYLFGKPRPAAMIEAERAFVDT